MAGFMERVRAALGSPGGDATPRAAPAVPLDAVVAEGDAREAASVDRVALERLRRRVECSPNGVYSLLATASLDARVSGVPARIPFNRFGWFDGALGAERSGRSWRIVGDRRHLHDALRFGLPSGPAALAGFVLSEAQRHPTEFRKAAVAERMTTGAPAADALAAVAGRLPRHVLAAALSCPERALAGLGSEGTAADVVAAVLALGVGVDEPLSEGLPSALACAAARGDDAAVAALLAAGADPKAFTFGHGPAFDAAALAGSAGTVELLAEAGYEFPVTDDEGRNALSFALDGPWIGSGEPPPGVDAMANFRDGRVFLALVDAGADPRLRDAFGGSPLEFVKDRARSSDRSDRNFADWVLSSLGDASHVDVLTEERDGEDVDISVQRRP